MSFNRLTSAEAERLALLLEELGEAQQVIGKILRHGYESYHPSDSEKRSNRALLEDEIGHVFSAVLMMDRAWDLSYQSIVAASGVKSQRVKKYMHHQE